MRLFLDTNILIDLLADRKPYSNSAYQIFKKASLNHWTIYASVSSILTTFYILEQRVTVQEANSAISTLLKRLEIQDLTKTELLSAVYSKTADLEDASQIACAMMIDNIDYVVTRDKKGFVYSPIEVIHPDELVQIYSDNDS